MSNATITNVATVAKGSLPKFHDGKPTLGNMEVFQTYGYRLVKGGERVRLPYMVHLFPFDREFVLDHDWVQVYVRFLMDENIVEGPGEVSGVTTDSYGEVNREDLIPHTFREQDTFAWRKFTRENG
jgi:hypothetical protein